MKSSKDLKTVEYVKFFLNSFLMIIGWVCTTYGVILQYFDKSYQALSIIVIFIIISSLIYFQFKHLKNINVNKSEQFSQEEVNKYLLDWISTHERTVIFTRDFSWAKYNFELFECLVNKSKRRELVICLSQKNEATNELEKLGAEVFEHNIPESNLKSRFIINGYGTNSPRVNVGSKKTNAHFVNEIYDVNSSSNACHSFVELFELAKQKNLAINNT